MEDKLTNILDNLKLEEASKLLDSELNFTLDRNIQNRIINSTKKKCDLNHHSSLSNKLRNILHIFLLQKKVVFSITSLVLTLGLCYGLYTYLQSPITYVSFDINPSVELGINKRNKVVHCVAYNVDGEKLLNNTSYKNLNIYNAISNLLSNAIDQNYVSNDKSFTISLATTVKDESTKSKLNDNLKNAIITTFNDNDIYINSDIDIVTSTSVLSKRIEAKNMGISFGKLNLIESLISLSPSIKVDDYKDKSIDTIQQKINELTNSNIPSVTKNENSSVKENVVDSNNTPSLPNSNLVNSSDKTNDVILNNTNTSVSNTTTSNKTNNNSSSSNSSAGSTTDTPPTSSGGSEENNNNNNNNNNDEPNNGNRPNNGHRPNKPNKPNHGHNKPNRPNKPGHWHEHDKYNDDDDDEYRHNNKHYYDNKKHN